MGKYNNHGLQEWNHYHWHSGSGKVKTSPGWAKAKGNKVQKAVGTTRLPMQVLLAKWDNKGLNAKTGGTIEKSVDRNCNMEFKISFWWSKQSSASQGKDEA